MASRTVFETPWCCTLVTIFIAFCKLHGWVSLRAVKSNTKASMVAFATAFPIGVRFSNTRHLNAFPLAALLVTTLGPVLARMNILKDSLLADGSLATPCDGKLG